MTDRPAEPSRPAPTDPPAADMKLVPQTAGEGGGNTAKGADRRRAPRRPAGGVPSPYGSLADLSETGACLFRKGPCRLKTGQLTTLQVREPGMELDLAARVVRMRQRGMRRHEVGLEFINVSPRQRVTLRMLIASAMPEFSPRAWLAA